MNTAFAGRFGALSLLKAVVVLLSHLSKDLLRRYGDGDCDKEEKGERCMTQQRLLCPLYGGGRLQVNTRANDGDREERRGERGSRVRSEQGHEQRAASERVCLCRMHVA